MKALENEPVLRIFNVSESRHLYDYFKGGINELRLIVQEIKSGKRKIEEFDIKN